MKEEIKENRSGVSAVVTILISLRMPQLHFNERPVVGFLAKVYTEYLGRRPSLTSTSTCHIFFRDLTYRFFCVFLPHLCLLSKPTSPYVDLYAIEFVRPITIVLAWLLARSILS